MTDKNKGDSHKRPSTSGMLIVDDIAPPCLTKFQPLKIKRIMQKNREIGKIQKDVPVLVGRAVHRMIKDVTQAAADITLKRGKTGSCLHFKMSKEDLAEAIMNTPKFKFLRKIVEDIPNSEENQNEGRIQIVKADDEDHPKTSILGKRRKPAISGMDEADLDQN